MPGPTQPNAEWALSRVPFHCTLSIDIVDGSLLFFQGVADRAQLLDKPGETERIYMNLSYISLNVLKFKGPSRLSAEYQTLNRMIRPYNPPVNKIWKCQATHHVLLS